MFCRVWCPAGGTVPIAVSPSRAVVWDREGRTPDGRRGGGRTEPVMEGPVPRAPWRRRRSTDSPRPAGRWAGRLRRGGTVARQVLLVRMGRRRRDAVGPATPIGAATHSGAHRTEPLSERATLAARRVDTIAPISPAVPGTGVGPTGPLTIALVPGQRPGT